MLRALSRLYSYVRPILPGALRVRIVGSFSAVRARLIGRFAPAVLAVGYNGALLVPSRDVALGWHLAEYGEYGKDQVTFLKSRIRAESQVLIVGAHVGALLVPLAKVAGRVVGIEANPDTFRLLEMNVKLNSLTNVELCNFAAGDRSGEVDFLMAEANSGASRLSLSHVRDRTGWDASAWVAKAPSKVRVAMRKLDEAFPDRAFDLVVMDIEGTELAALPGMKDILARAETFQVEILPLYMKKIARTSTAEAVQRLGAGFNSAIYMAHYGKRIEFSRARFNQLAAEIDRTGGGDVIFLRGASNAIAA